jgi:hypothetical protein
MRGKTGLALVVAGLLLVILAFVAPQPRSGAPSVSVETGTAQPEVEGNLKIYVNNELKYSGKVHSFLKPAPTFLALGFFPTSSFQSASVNFYNEYPSTWTPYSGAGSGTPTFNYGGSGSSNSVWGTKNNIAPLLLIYDTKGNKWTEVSLSTTPSIYYNSTGVLLSISGSVTPSLNAASNVSMIRFVRPTGISGTGWSPYFAVRLAEDTLPSPVTVNPGDSLTVVYQFYFKADQIFTANWANAFFAWLYNVAPAKINVTATDGSTDYIDPYSSSGSNPANNAPVNCYIVVGNGQATFSRTAYKVVSEVTRAGPSVQVYGGGVSLSYAFTFSQDTTITELAVYVKLRSGKEVMVFYYVLPQPTVAKAGVPFTVTFRINLPYADRV